MSYFAPYLDESGLHIPTYADRLEALLASYRSVFGPEINLAESSPDYQLLSIFARALDDISALLVSLFAARNPSYAAGTALDLLLSLYGLTRRGATYSTAAVTLTGTPNAVLSAAPEFLDDHGNIWACQTAGLTLDVSGSLTVEAVCRTPGAVAAPAGTIRSIVTPVAGLASVTNPTAAAPGEERETDAAARHRLRLAASAPSRTMPDALMDALWAVPNVRACRVYVNETENTDANGLPPHSICAVLAGGTNANIAKAIFEKKAPGIQTHGAASASVTDAWGNAHTIHFQRVSSVYSTISIGLTALSGFDQESMVPAIRAEVQAYADRLNVGESLTVNSLYGVIYGAVPQNPPVFRVNLLTATVSPSGQLVTDVVPAAWNQRITIPSNFINISVT